MYFHNYLSFLSSTVVLDNILCNASVKLVNVKKLQLTMIYTDTNAHKKARKVSAF